MLIFLQFRISIKDCIKSVKIGDAAGWDFIKLFIVTQISSRKLRICFLSSLWSVELFSKCIFERSFSWASNQRSSSFMLVMDTDVCVWKHYKTMKSRRYEYNQHNTSINYWVGNLQKGRQIVSSTFFLWIGIFLEDLVHPLPWLKAYRIWHVFGIRR